VGWWRVYKKVSTISTMMGAGNSTEEYLREERCGGVGGGEREEEGSVAKPFTSLANAHAPPTLKLIPSAKLSRFWQLIVAFVM
jgi:hypothetical protein